MAQSELAIHVPVEVLATQLDMTDLLAKAATIEELFKTAFIPTDRHSEYSRWIDELRILKHCGRAIGPRDVGKSQTQSPPIEEESALIFIGKPLTRSKTPRGLPKSKISLLA